MNKGIAPLLILVALGGVILSAIGSYTLYQSRTSSNSNSDNSDIGSTSQAMESSDGSSGGSSDDPFNFGDPESAGIEIFEDVEAEQAALKAMMDYIEAHQNDIYTEEQQEQDLADIQEVVRSDAQTALEKSFCQASLGDVTNSLMVAERAQKSGLNELADELIEWAKNGYTYHVTEIAPTWIYDYNDEILHTWAYHAEFAAMMGLENLFEMILKGNVDLSGWMNQNCGRTKDPIIGSPPDTLISNTLSKDFCEANLGTIRDALKVMALAQKLGRDKDADLWEWVQNGFKAIVKNDHESWDDTERTKYSEIAMKLGMGDLADQITNKTVNLESWYKYTCTTDGAYSVNFTDTEMKRVDEPMKLIITVTDARAYTCDGLYSQWKGTMHTKVTLTNMIHEQQPMVDEDSKFTFFVEKPNPEKPRTTGTRLEGNKLTYWLLNGGWYTGKDEITGTITRGAPECEEELRRREEQERNRRDEQEQDDQDNPED